MHAYYSITLFSLLFVYCLHCVLTLHASVSLTVLVLQRLLNQNGVTGKLLAYFIVQLVTLHMKSYLIYINLVS